MLVRVDHLRSGRSSLRDIEGTKEAIETQHSTSTPQLSDFLGYSKDTIVFYEFNEIQAKGRVEKCANTFLPCRKMIALLNAFLLAMTNEFI
ncbi:hypothetical protein EVAR_83338_1 [Eumeta japonica]|uniref:Uncharacterized protein n=1 Tax=Eumeta variegata TaxID=151549 RepID=A0A4C1VX74_EUMVA|nr:hypothetical protein EVAR_83338_1 [Eumeta japonica]